MAIDYYAYAKDIATELDEAGHEKYAIDIREAVKFGSTNTEILMALRFILAKVVKEVVLPDNLKLKCSVTINAINAVLN